MENSLLSGLLKKGPQRRGGLGAEKGAEEDRQPCGRTGWKSTFDGQCGCAEQPGGIPSEGARAMEEERGRRRTGQCAERMPPEEAEERAGKHGTSSSGRTACGRKRRKVVQLRLLKMEQVILGLSDDMKTSLRRWC